MSKTRKVYFARLVGRCLILIFSIALLIYDKSQFEVLQDWNFFREFSVLHILWLIWLIDMVAQLVPAKGYIALGSQKHFLKRFQPVVERINYDALKEYIVNTTKSAYKVFLIWCLLIIAIATLYFTDVLSREIIFIISVFFYVCDLICVLIWCPFRLLMKNKCCTTCRIFNWDHLMMFSPYLMIPGFYTTSLLVIAFAVWVVWELCVMMYPERFWENSNMALRCSECTDKLCTQYCRKLRK